MKRGISSVVASVLIILLIVFAVLCLWLIILPVLGNGVDAELGVLTIDVSEGYTFWDEERGVFCVHVERRADEVPLDGMSIIFVINGSSLEPFFVEDVVGINGAKKYCFSLPSEPEEVAVGPIVDGVEGEISSRISFLRGGGGGGGGSGDGDSSGFTIINLVDDVSKKDFKVYISPRRAISDSRIIKVPLLTDWYFWGDRYNYEKKKYVEGHRQYMPHEDWVKDNVGALDGDFFVVDIENDIFWPHDLRKNSSDVVNWSVDNLRMVFDWIREVKPNAEFCIYRIMPIRDYWTPIRNDSVNMSKWREANEYLRRLSEEVDFICPSLYYFHNESSEMFERWKVYARANIEEARIYGKPIYPFLMPQPHISNAKAIAYKNANKVWPPIESDYFWRAQLDLVREEADSVFIFTMGDFYLNGSWVNVTSDFMDDNGIG